MTQKEKKIKEHTRHLKNGKIVRVRQHTARYDAAEEQMTSKKEGAGKELESVRSKNGKLDGSVQDWMDMLGFSADDFKEWYEWDTEDDPKNEAALRVEKALKKDYGKKVYQDIYDTAVENYKKGGATKFLNSYFAEGTETRTAWEHQNTRAEEAKDDKGYLIPDTREVAPTKTTKTKNPKSDGGSKKGVESTKKKIPNLIDDPKSPWYEFENNFEEGWAGDPDVYCLANFPHHREVANLAAHNLSKKYDGNTFYNLKDCDGIAQKAYNKAAKQLYPKEKLWSGTESENPEFWKEHKASKSELPKKRTVGRSSSTDAATIKQMRDTANQMEASMNKAAQKKAIKSMLAKGYTKHTTEGEVWFFKPTKEGSYNGSYKVMDDKGAIKTASPSSKEGFKKRIAGKLGIKYKPKNYK